MDTTASPGSPAARSVAPGVVAYNAALGACGRASSAESAAQLLRRMDRLQASAKRSRACGKSGIIRVAPTCRTFGAAVGAMGRGHAWQAAVGLLEKMRSSPGGADAVAHAGTVSACAKAIAWKQALQLLRPEVGEWLLEPMAPAALTVAIAACDRASLWQEALAVYTDMPNRKMVPSLASLNSALSACSRCSEWEQALAVRATAPSSDLVTSGLLVRAMERAGRWALGLALFESQAVEKGTVAFTAAISCCALGRRWQQALAILRRMPAQQVPMTRSTKNAVLSGQPSMSQQRLPIFQGPGPPRAARRAGGAMTLALAVFAMAATAEGAWYDGIPSVRVFGPADAELAQGFLDSHYNKLKMGEFSVDRLAVLLKRGDYKNLSIGVPFYTSVAGVGRLPEEVIVRKFYVESRLSSKTGGATKTFWRSVEGLLARETSLWATSQACPMRRCILQGDLLLSSTFGNETAEGPSSGGFIADTQVVGKVHLGTQQQFFFRNCELGGIVKGKLALNNVYLGVHGAPEVPVPNAPQMVSRRPTVDRVAEKPFLTEQDGIWEVVVPDVAEDTAGRYSGSSISIPIEDMYVAKEGDTAATINAGIIPKRGLLLTPGIYELSTPIVIMNPGFVVLGLGFPTLVAMADQPAILQLAENVRVASVLLEGGASVTMYQETQPLLHWSGALGVASDIFARVGSFNYSTAFLLPCQGRIASIFVQVEGIGVVLDHAWLWHADHDDCSARWPNSVSATTCKSSNALVVTGPDVIAYCLQAEHTFKDQVLWLGENGKLFFYQNELPYISPYPGDLFGRRYASYRVSPFVLKHLAVGLGSYSISIPGYSYVANVSAFLYPEAAQLQNVMVWHITSDNRTPFFENLACTRTGGRQLWEVYFMEAEFCQAGPRKGRSNITLLFRGLQHGSPKAAIHCDVLLTIHLQAPF
ncbi:unnamed protein product [Effrenium voratum]|nr:unnamed protein product [Effrenium voratum]